MSVFTRFSRRSRDLAVSASLGISESRWRAPPSPKTGDKKDHSAAVCPFFFGPVAFFASTGLRYCPV